MLEEHLGYVDDAVRLERFRAAIAKVVVPAHTVADLGCGTGILGLLCLQAGAKHVFAVDESGMIEIARESINRAGYGARATFIRGRSSQIELPERVDVVLCDHVGFIGIDYGVMEFLEDAKRRFLKPGGILVPSRIRLNLAVVGSDECSKAAHGWHAETIPPEFRWLHEYSVNAKHALNLGRDDVLSQPVVLGDIDLQAESPAFLSWHAELLVERDGVVNGIGGWFDCELAKDVWMTNSPLSERPIRRPQGFLPIGESVSVRRGDVIDAKVMMRPSEHLIAWNVEFRATGKRFAQSTWQGMLLSAHDMSRANPDRVPQASLVGQHRATVLGYCDGRRTIREIELAVIRDHPHMFPSFAEISRFVAEVLGRETA